MTTKAAFPPGSDAESIAGPHLDRARCESLARDGEPSDDEALHLLSCAACSARVEGFDEGDANPLEPALALLRAAGDHEASADEPKAEAALLRRAEEARSERFLRRRRVGVSVGLVPLAAAALLAFAVRRTGDPPPPSLAPSHATIVAAPNAELRVVQGGADEVVGLEGEATFSVKKMAPGERFRVRSGPDEVEVRGTRFVVLTEAGLLRDVRVEEGVVEVRAACCAARTLRPGEHWSRATEAALAVPTATSNDTPPSPIPAGSIEPSTPTPTPTSTSTGGTAGVSGTELLAQGTAAYDAGRYGAAASLLGRAVVLEPKASWAKDASTLAGAARILAASPAAIPSVGASVASFDTAAARARARGDLARASAASLGAARHLAGPAAAKRFCALKADASLSAAQRQEAEQRCK